ncbi:MAG: sugar ABC transporter permease, partial [Anaerolineae bacterium]|nr:sugar ABC transporter permease [Anaerolineae bacterium]
MITSDKPTRSSTPSQSITQKMGISREAMLGWLFVLPALALYAVFVLFPILQSVRYSFFNWNGIGE